MRRTSIALVAACLPLLAEAQALPPRPVGTGVATAETLDLSQLDDTELLDLLNRVEALRRARPRRFGIFGIPSGFGMPPGYGFVAAAATNRRDRRPTGDADASLAFGFGFGDPDTGVGITPVIDVTSVAPHHFGESGRVGVKLSRTLGLGAGWLGAAALDLDSLVTWGDARSLDPTANLSLTAIRLPGPGNRVPFMVTAGYGSGVADRGTGPGLFAGIGVGLGPASSVSLAWYGDEAIAGANFWPDPAGNLQISLGIGDIGNNVSGRRLLFAVAIAAPFSALQRGMTP